MNCVFASCICLHRARQTARRPIRADLAQPCGQSRACRWRQVREHSLSSHRLSAFNLSPAFSPSRALAFHKLDSLQAMSGSYSSLAAWWRFTSLIRFRRCPAYPANPTQLAVFCSMPRKPNWNFCFLRRESKLVDRLSSVRALQVHGPRAEAEQLTAEPQPATESSWRRGGRLSVRCADFACGAGMQDAARRHARELVAGAGSFTFLP
eukprot:6184619-Pleurochrysis_carterae.AAC.4